MKNRSFRGFYILSVLGVLLASAYPLYMGIRVVVDMIRLGAVPVESYPKYVIPYTPISLAVLIGVLLMHLTCKLFKSRAFLGMSVVCLLVFFISEHFMETKILVQTTQLVELESWQLALCYVPPEMYETRVWEAVDVLLGGYSPAFKIHFYIISVVLILSILNCFYGFADMILTGNKKRKKPLILQSVSCAAFLGMCIWACFTAFYRTGELLVSPLSAVLMCVFFALFGLTTGIIAGSFLLNGNKWLSVALPAFISSLVTLVMYIAEMCLLNGHLYRFGSGFFFSSLGVLVLAPVDILVVVLSGVICAGILYMIKDKKAEE